MKELLSVVALGVAVVAGFQLLGQVNSEPADLVALRRAVELARHELATAWRCEECSADDLRDRAGITLQHLSQAQAASSKEQ